MNNEAEVDMCMSNEAEVDRFDLRFFLRQLVSFNPAMPIRIRPMQAMRATVAGSPNKTMPIVTAPTVPIPVQTA